MELEEADVWEEHPSDSAAASGVLEAEASEQKSGLLHGLAGSAGLVGSAASGGVGGLGAVGATAPAAAAIYISARRFSGVSAGSSGGDDRGAAATRDAADAARASANLMGSSMPINIPMMGRGAASERAAGAAAAGRAATFVPPHLLEQQQEAGSGQGGMLLSGVSPSASLKRDKLLQRNAILRRTGFIEAGGSPLLPEILDPIREGRPLVLQGGELSRAMGGGSIGRMTGRRVASSLSQALVADASPRS
ncbi:hypothetical protein WJX81_007912 [Elliptochloris bilobata]|uniref:Uncharacterized protein n=1 Tax=Elliptochloris bilobata TaxID=381761 RepID=A0AAW1RX71_9CHLO